MVKRIELGAILFALTLVLSGLARAQWDSDDGYYRQGDRSMAQQYGDQNGYHEGIKHGRHEGRENDPEDFHIPDDGHASRGYRDWMGPIWVYQNAYREGYRAGFRAGYNRESRTWSNSDTADFPVVYGGNYGGIWSGNQSHEIGFRDGALVAREDIREGKPYNPNPRGRYEDRARDYRGQYASGYRAGYESTRGRY
jgi:hypothetical protein